MSQNFTSVADFVANESFIHYCFKDNEKDVAFWEQWIETHPNQSENAQKAIKLLYLISIKAGPEKKSKDWQALKENKLTPQERKRPYPVSVSRKNKFRKLWIAAAVTVLIIGAGGLSLWIHTLDPTPGYLTYQTVSGEKKQITLPDHTEVWLNSDSKLIFNNNLKQSVKREVTLTGEAYFKVQKNQDRPFIIHANALNIEVLGTEFNVNAYSESLTTSATLIRGAIQVYLKNDPRGKVLLKPNEKFTVSNPEKIQAQVMKSQKKTLPDAPRVPDFKITRVQNDPLLADDDILETAWLDGKLAFRNEDFEELALQLNHKYGVRFHFETQALKAYKFTGIFTKETLPEALDALQLTSPSHPFKYRIEGEKVFITN